MLLRSRTAFSLCRNDCARTTCGRESDHSANDLEDRGYLISRVRSVSFTLAGTPHVKSVAHTIAGIPQVRDICRSISTTVTHNLLLISAQKIGICKDSEGSLCRPIVIADLTSEPVSFHMF